MKLLIHPVGGDHTGPVLKLGLEVAKWLNLNVRAVIDCVSKVNDNNAALLRKVEENLCEKFI